MTFSRAVSTNNYGPYKFIVDGTTTANGTHSTIATALTSSSSGDTIFIRPGTYTENLTLKAGVNITSASFEGTTPAVTIIGNMTASYSGTATVSNVRLQTTSANIITLSGANVTLLNVNNCYLNCTNNTGISSAGSNASSKLTLTGCSGDLGTTGIGLFAVSNGAINFTNCIFTNSGSSLTASTLSSAASLSAVWSQFNCAITTSNTAAIALGYCFHDTSVQNLACLNVNGTGNSSAFYSRMASGTATPLTIGTGATFVAQYISLDHANATAVSGLGTLTYTDICQTNTIGAISPTTTTGKGHIGILGSVAPSAGYIGQIISSNIATPGTTLTSATGANVTSIALTKGTWLITGAIVFAGAASGQTTAIIAASNTTTATIGTAGPDYLAQSYSTTGGIQQGVEIPAKVVSISSTTTYYLVAYSIFTVATVTAYGYIQGTRIA